MATIQRYYEENPPSHAQATIVAVSIQGDRAAIVLDESLFYPEGGGQAGDRGTIAGIPIIDVKEENGTIYHFVELKAAYKLSTGKAEMVLDTERRRDLSCQHSAQHLLSATILKKLGFPTVSMRLGTDGNTIDVETPELGPSELSEVELAAYELIEADLPIRSHLCPPEDLSSFPLRKQAPLGADIIRIIEIEGYDFSPCCGVHVTSTGKIGLVKIIGTEKYKGMTRVSFVAGKRAFLDYHNSREALERIAKHLGVRPDMVEDRTRLSIDRLARQDRTLITLREALATHEAEKLVTRGGKIIIENFLDRSLDEALRVGRALQKRFNGVILVASTPELRVAFLTANPSVDLRPKLKDLAECHDFKGGGGPAYYQAAFTTRAALERFLADSHKVFLE